MLKKFFSFIIILFFCHQAFAMVQILSAENFYAEVIKELGGDYIKVSSILNSPNDDPHLFTISPSTAKSISEADIIIYNGADYDPWIHSLIHKETKNQYIINVAELMKVTPGSNPHIWYNPQTMPIFANKIVSVLIQFDPAHQSYFEKQLNNFNQSYQAIYTQIKKMNSQFNNTPIIATEPVFNDMAESIGLLVQGKGFQISMMNDVTPAISQVKDFEDNIRQHRVKVMIFNKQVQNPMTQHMLALAEQEHIPIVGITEALPEGMTYVQWMLSQLKALEKALT